MVVKKPAFMSSTDGNNTAELAVDGDIRIHPMLFARTTNQEGPWLVVNMQDEVWISSVIITNGGEPRLQFIPFIRVFHKRTKLAIMPMLAFLYCNIFISFLFYLQHKMLVYRKLDISGYYRITYQGCGLHWPTSLQRNSLNEVGKIGILVFWRVCENPYYLSLLGVPGSLLTKLSMTFYWNVSSTYFYLRLNS